MLKTVEMGNQGRLAKVNENRRNQEFAQTLIDGLGYSSAIETAQKSNWHKVADTIRFMAANSYRRF